MIAALLVAGLIGGGWWASRALWLPRLPKRVRKGWRPQDR